MWARIAVAPPRAIGVYAEAADRAAGAATTTGGTNSNSAASRNSCSSCIRCRGDTNIMGPGPAAAGGDAVVIATVGQQNTC